MEGGQEMMSESLVERGQSEPPPITSCVDLLSDAALQNINKSHVGHDLAPVSEMSEESPTTYFNEHHCGNILKVLRQQQSKAELCDTVLIVNNRHIPVHSCVIAANSPYFKALFDTSERIPGQPVQISLPTTSFEVADNLIGYMYSGDISITTQYVEELLQLTDKLIMDDVRQCCELHMIKFLDLSNWSSSQVLAKTHAFQDLAKEVIKFLAQNLMIIKNTAEFHSLLSTDVIEILKQSNTNEGSDLELCKLEFLLNWIIFDMPNNVVHFGELLQCINPQLLNTEGVNKIFCELAKQELCEHELSQQIRAQVEAIEKLKEEERTKQLTKEAEAKQVVEEAVKNVLEGMKVTNENTEEGQIETGEAQKVIELERQFTDQVKGTPIQTETNDSQVDQPLQTVNTDAGEIPNKDMNTSSTNTGSDTEIDDNGSNAVNNNAVIKDNKEKKTADNADSSSQDDQDSNRYLDDGTLIIQPQSAWHGRGKRKSYRPKKIHSGRPRGRPRRQVPAPIQKVQEEVEAPHEVSQRPRRRARPTMKAANMVKKVRAKTSRTVAKRDATAAPSLDDVKDEAAEAEPAEAEVDEQEVQDQDDKDPSWTPINIIPTEVGEVKIPAKRGQKRKGPLVIEPVVKVAKKRGRKPNPGDKTYYCDKCPRTFKLMGALSHHMKGHGSDTPMLCEICGFSTRHYGSMNVHQRKHAGKVMHCPYEGCDHTEVHRERIDDHISAVHHGVKRHMCSICGKSFGAKKHLQRHEGLHGRAKDIACTLCNYVTNRTDKLREHIRRHHPVVAVNMGMMKPEDMNKVSPPKPRPPKKPKEPKQPKKKKVPTATLR